MDYKYTKDGKKVAVIGDLNKNEKIVQEIFVSNGKEYPAGENFTVKTLLDKPAETWQEKRIQEIEENYNEAKASKLEEISSLKRAHEKKAKVIREKLKYIGKVIDNLEPDVFETLGDVLTGEINYIVQLDYRPKILTGNEFFNDKTIKSDFDGLKIISIFGRDDGTMTYGLGSYSDGSGGYTKFVPCRTYEEAVEEIKTYIESKNYYSDFIIQTAEEYNITLDKEQLKTHYDKRLKELQESLKRKQKDQDEVEEKVEKIKLRMKEIRNKI